MLIHDSETSPDDFLGFNYRKQSLGIVCFDDCFQGGNFGGSNNAINNFARFTVICPLSVQESSRRASSR